MHKTAENLSPQAISKLSKLAITVELNLGQRIRVRDTLEDAAKLLTLAIPSDNPEVSAGSTELLAELSKDQLQTLATLNVPIESPKKKSSLSYRGSTLATADKASSNKKKSTGKSYRGVRL